MIEATVTMKVTAENDEQADAIFQAVRALTNAWPGLPLVALFGERREVVEA